MAELGSHQLDAASIFISAMRTTARRPGRSRFPPSAAGTSSRSTATCEDHVYCMFEFPGPNYDPKIPNKKIVVTYSSINGNGFGGYGEVVIGTEGTLVLENEKDVLLYPNSGTSTHVKVAANKKGGAVLNTSDKRRGPCGGGGQEGD